MADKSREMWHWHNGNHFWEEPPMSVEECEKLSVTPSQPTLCPSVHGFGQFKSRDALEVNAVLAALDGTKQFGDQDALRGLAPCIARSSWPFGDM